MLLAIATLVSCQVEDPGRTFCSNFCETCYWQRDVCEVCGERFYFHEFFKVCLEGSLLGCKVYASRTVCAECDEGYKNVKGVCQRCALTLCGTCEKNIGVCESCRIGFSFNTVTPTTSTCLLQCAVDNCKKCFDGSGSFCEVCLEGYRRTPSDSCEKCTQEGCKLCTTSASVCDGSCLSGYYILNGKCETCMTGCKTCSSTGTCLACDTNQNYYMDLSRTCIKSAWLHLITSLGLFAFTAVSL